MEIIPEGRHFRLVHESELPEILVTLERYLPESLKVCAILTINWTVCKYIYVCILTIVSTSHCSIMCTTATPPFSGNLTGEQLLSLPLPRTLCESCNLSPNLLETHRCCWPVFTVYARFTSIFNATPPPPPRGTSARLFITCSSSLCALHIPLLCSLHVLPPNSKRGRTQPVNYSAWHQKHQELGRHWSCSRTVQLVLLKVSIFMPKYLAGRAWSWANNLVP